jgi:hypothetical protein
VIEHLQSTPVVGGALQILRSGVVSYGVFAGTSHRDDRQRTDAALTIAATYGHGVARYRPTDDDTRPVLGVDAAPHGRGATFEVLVHPTLERQAALQPPAGSLGLQLVGC